MGIVSLSDQNEGKQFLFLIGIDDYQNQKPLYNAVKDLKDIAAILWRSFGFSKELTYEHYNENATTKDIHNRFNELLKLINEEDSLLIYFSGHGHLDEDGSGYWLLSDFDLENKGTCFYFSMLRDYINRVKAKHVCLISDSCFSRALLADFKTGDGNLDAPEKTKSRCALTSGGFLVEDGVPGQNSPFATALRELLLKTERDFYFGEFAIEVRKIVSINSNQTPQYGPIQNSGHMGGEYKFYFQPKNNQKNQGIEQDEVRGYKDVLKILELRDPKGNFKLLKDGKVEDKVKKIGFEVYGCNDPIFKTVNFYLYIYKGVDLNNTFSYLRHHFSEVLKKKSQLFVFFSKNTENGDHEKRKSKIENELSPISVQYLEDFIWEYCTPAGFADNFENHRDSFLTIENFVEPAMQGFQGNKLYLAELGQWLLEPSKPIMVLTGDGGVGKTTVARYCSDLFYQTREKSEVIFLDAYDLGLYYKRFGQNTPFLFDFYQNSDIFETLEKKMTYDQFRINLDAGNILVIIDGLDEIISQFSDFEVEDFLLSILDDTMELGSGKVIITCRSYFWNQKVFGKDFVNKESLIERVEVLPFDFPRAKDFFQKTFKTDKKKVEKAISIADEIFKPQSSNGIIKYHPYGLDVITKIISDEKKELVRDKTFFSKFLNAEVVNDFILYRICVREQNKLGRSKKEINIDDHIHFFIKLSNKFNGQVPENKMDELIQEVLGFDVGEKYINSFKAHTLLVQESGFFKLRYDFFLESFKSIYLVSFITLEGGGEEIPPELLEILASDCRFGSHFLDEVKVRVKSWTEEEILKISYFVGLLLKEVKSDYFEKVKKNHRAISGLLAIALTLNHKFNSGDKDKNTDLLLKIFSQGSGLHVFGVHMINYSKQPNSSLRFDFRGMKLENCHFENYADFVLCDFDELTFFKGCSFNRIATDLINDNFTKISKNNFDHSCVFFDDSLEHVLEYKDLIDQREEIRVSKFLSDFLKIFRSGGRLEKQGYEWPIRKRFLSFRYKPIDLDSLLTLLINIGLAKEEKVGNARKFFIAQEYRDHVIKFLEDGQPSSFLLKIIQKLAKT